MADNAPAPANWLAEAWSKQLATVLESMAGEAPQVKFTACQFSDTMSVSGEDGFHWWQQSFSLGPEALVWIGASERSWQEVGSRVLRSAGVDEQDHESIKSTYLEIVNQALSGIAGEVSSRAGREVACAEGQLAPPTSTEAISYSFEVTFGEVTFPVLGVFAKSLSELGTQTVPAVNSAAPLAASVKAPAPAPPPPNSIDLLLDVELPVSISFGRAQLALKDVIKLTTGSIVELNRAVSEPVEVIVNNCVIARGEVVVVEGNFGIRVKQVISRQERLRTLN
jgi:flagellar motor switch protein FliN/FliY